MAKNDEFPDEASPPPFERYLFAMMEKGELSFPKGVVHPEERLAEEPLSDAVPEHEPARPAPQGWKKWRVGLEGWTRPTRPIWQWAAAFLFVVMVSSIALLGLYPSPLSQLAYVEPNATYADRSLAVAADEPFIEYYQGVDLLQKSQLWRFVRVDQAKVDAAIQHLETAKRRAVSENNQAYMAQCCFYLGKAYLKKKEVAQARRQFEEILKLDGASAPVRKAQIEAENMLTALKKLEPGV